MRRTLLLATTLIISACDAPDDFDVAVAPDVAPADAWAHEEPGAALPPPGTLDVDHTGELFPGGILEILVTNMPAGDTAHVLVSTRGVGNGPCPGLLGGICLDIKRPTLVGSAAAPNGTATVEVTIPSGVAPGTTLFVQAARPDGANSDTSNVLELEVGDPPPPVSYTLDIEPILSVRCSGCHIGGQSGGFALSYATMVDTPSLDVPSMPRMDCSGGLVDNSYLWHKLSGTQVAAGGNGSRMPLGGPFLATADMDLIRAWVESGCAL